jgi:hypothetical protein
MLEFEPGMSPKHTVCSQVATHDEAVVAVSIVLNTLSEVDQIKPEDAKSVISQIKNKRTNFTVYLISRDGLIRGFAWGRAPILTSKNANRLLNKFCKFDFIPAAVVEGAPNPPRSTNARKERKGE